MGNFRLWLEKVELHHNEKSKLIKQIKDDFLGAAGSINDQLKNIKKTKQQGLKGSKEAANILRNLGVFNKMEDWGGTDAGKASKMEKMLDTDEKAANMSVHDMLTDLFGDYEHFAKKSADAEEKKVYEPQPGNAPPEKPGIAPPAGSMPPDMSGMPPGQMALPEPPGAPMGLPPGPQIPGQPAMPPMGM